MIRVCSYYSFTTNKWETDSCTLINKTKTNYTCSCSHLTDFAINTNDVVNVYEKSNARYVLQKPDITDFNLLRYPSFYIPAALSVICFKLMISANNSERYYDIDEFVISKNNLKSFKKYSYLYCKIKLNGCSNEMKKYIKKKSYFKAFLRDYYKFFMVHFNIYLL